MQRIFYQRRTHNISQTMDDEGQTPIQEQSETEAFTHGHPKSDTLSQEQSKSDAITQEQSHSEVPTQKQSKAEPANQKKSKAYRCYFCGQKFPDMKELKKCITSHKDRPFECEICDRKFTLEYNLQKHMLVHTKEKPFMCDKCGKTFSQNWNLKKHMETHNSSNNNRTNFYGLVDCKGCDKFTRLPNVLCWRCTFHGKRIREDGKYFCALCYLVFENIEHLNNHVLEHRVCEKKRLLKQRAELQCDNFRCSRCKQSFIRERNYNKHILKCGKVPANKPPPRKRFRSKLKLPLDLAPLS